MSLMKGTQANMGMEANNREAVIQNLMDAGCETEQVEEFLALGKDGDMKKQMRLLERHRQVLLAAMHLEQKRIDCLDYLMFRMKKGTTV